ncbi:MAG: DUF2490 domain-containing protein [Spirosomaceae bacterium]|nr:DUF2490 domain-containing protein [Spirosomataceae bacterium]
MKHIILAIFWGFNLTHLYAQTQKQVIQENQLWLGYFNQTRLTDKWGLWADIHARATDDFVGAPSKFLFRAGLMYYLTDDLKLTNGYNFINHFPEEGHANISMPEHRMWQQLQLHTKYGKVRTMQWLRLEERWRRNIKNDSELAEGYRFDTRLRFNYMLNLPLSKKGIVPKTFFVAINNEIFVNLSRKIVYNTFDQNRFFAGISYQTGAHSNLQVGYMNVYQQLGAGSRYRSFDTIRLFYFQNLDVRKNASKNH